MLKNKLLLPKDPSNAKTPWLWIGTWSMGGEGFGSHDEKESLKVLHTAVDNDIHHFDTAGFYAHSKSEKLLQKIIKTDRQEFFISSKGGLVWNGRKVTHRASPEELKRQLFESLERLKTDYLDLYQLHWPDPEVPVRESIHSLKELQQEGLIRFWGVGNLREQDVRDILQEEINIPHQVHFNPIHRNESVLQAGMNCCINCITSPLEQGLLGRGKSSFGKQSIGNKDLRVRNPYFSDPKVVRWNNRLGDLLNQHSLSKVSLVLMWICSRPHVHGVIPGPRKMEQLNEILEFKSNVERNNLLSSGETDSILSATRLRSRIPEEIWHHLTTGPDDKFD
jgi:aryl-alcohol dehydrogenase-like predicted oxidoreductase